VKLPNGSCGLRVACFASMLALLAAPTAACAQWPQFRGPEGQGHTTAKGLPLSWSETENIVWKTPLVGKGWSSPVIEGNQIWMTAAIESPVTPEERKKRLEGNTTGDPTLVVVGQLSLRALCVDLASGKLLHDIELMSEDQPDPIHSLNSFASPTPVIERGRLYCHFGTNGTACLDTATQKVLWTNRKLKIKHENGPGSSPVLWGDLLIVHCDGSDLQYLAALDKSTGDLAWKTERTGKMNSNPQLKKAYGTPLIVDVAGKPTVLSPAADWLYAYDPASGAEQWKVPYGALGFSIVPRPVAGHGMLFMCTSFMQSELLAIRYDGQGEKKEPHIVWRYAKQAPQMPSPVLVGDEIYVVSDKGVASCLDAKTGTVHWTERLGGNFCASPLAADGRIYFSNRDGLTTVIEPGKTFKPLAKNDLKEGIMASPAAIDGALIVRTDKALYRLGAKP